MMAEERLVSGAALPNGAVGCRGRRCCGRSGGGAETYWSGKNGC